MTRQTTKQPKPKTPAQLEQEKIDGLETQIAAARRARRDATTDKARNETMHTVGVLRSQVDCIEWLRDERAKAAKGGA